LVEIWVGGEKRLDVDVRLSGYVEVSVIPTLGPEQLPPMDGVTSWEGLWYGMAESDAMDLIAEVFELRFPDGRVGRVRLDDTAGKLRGMGETPFG
jgi:hypothetical protein